MGDDKPMAERKVLNPWLYKVVPCSKCKREFRMPKDFDREIICEDCDPHMNGFFDRCSKSEQEENAEYIKRAKDWIFENGKLTGAEGKEFIKYVFNQ